MGNVLIDLPERVPGLIPEIPSEPQLRGRRWSRDGSVQQRSQESNLKPGAHRFVVGSVELELLAARCGFGHGQEILLNRGCGDGALAELLRIVSVTGALDRLRAPCPGEQDDQRGLKK